MSSGRTFIDKPSTVKKWWKSSELREALIRIPNDKTHLKLLFSDMDSEFSAFIDGPNQHKYVITNLHTEAVSDNSK